MEIDVAGTSKPDAIAKSRHLDAGEKLIGVLVLAHIDGTAIKVSVRLEERHGVECVLLPRRQVAEHHLHEATSGDLGTHAPHSVNDRCRLGVKMGKCTTRNADTSGGG